MRVRKLLERESGDPGIGQPRWSDWSAAGTAKGKPSMNEAGKSDAPIVPEKRSNKASPGRRTAESVEGRGAAKGNTDQSDTGRAQDRIAVSRALASVRIAAQRGIAQRAATRQDPRQEPGAVVPHAGICAGGGLVTGLPYRDRRRSAD